MKALLTSAGIKNATINEAMVNLLGKPIAECSALCIPTGAYRHPFHPFVGWRFISGHSPNTPMCELGWKSLGVVELSALASIDEEQWVPSSRRPTSCSSVAATRCSWRTGCASPGSRSSCRAFTTRSMWG